VNRRGIQCEDGTGFRGSLSGVSEGSLRCDSLSLGNWFLTFRRTHGVHLNRLEPLTIDRASYLTRPISQYECNWNAQYDIAKGRNET
jgi:hypothetical protein